MVSEISISIYAGSNFAFHGSLNLNNTSTQSMEHETRILFEGHACRENSTSFYSIYTNGTVSENAGLRRFAAAQVLNDVVPTCIFAATTDAGAPGRP